MVFVSVFVAVAFVPPVHFLAKRGLKRGLATGAIFLSALLLAVGFVWAGLSHMGALKTAAGVAGESGAHAGAARGKQRCRRQCPGNPAFSADEGLHRWNQRDRATPGRVSA